MCVCKLVKLSSRGIALASGLSCVGLVVVVVVVDSISRYNR